MATASQSYVIPKSTGAGRPQMENGIHQAVVAEIKDLGVLASQFGEPKRKFAFRFLNADGEESSKLYTPSLHEKAALRKDFGSLVDLTVDAFDIFSLLGTQVQIISEQKQKGDYVNAQVLSVTKPAEGQNVKFTQSAEPVAAKKAPAPAKAATKTTNGANKKAQQAVDDEAACAGTEITDDDIPF